MSQEQLLSQLSQILQHLQPSYTLVPIQAPQPPQDPIHLREEAQTPPPRVHVDRWHTAVAVHVEIDGELRRMKWFSDLQSAWMSVRDFVNRNPSPEWKLRTFERTAALMDRRWEDGRGEDGLLIAKLDDVKFRAYYEPEENDTIHSSQSSSW